MKYKHYSPRADVVMVDADNNSFYDFAVSQSGANIYFLVFSDDIEHIQSDNVFSYGKDSTQQAHNLFAELRRLDDIGAEKIYVRMPEKSGVGLAVYNRLVRASGFEVLSL
jgi:L-threonylcarbamoyladenylate synthase